MEVRSKQQWSVDETQCLLELWASREVQCILEGASRKKLVLEQIQREMATAGYERNVEQINNKLKKLRKEYRDQKKSLGTNYSGQAGRNPHFDLLDSVLGDRPPACHLPRDLTSPPALPTDPDSNTAKTCRPVTPLELITAEDAQVTTGVTGKRKRGCSDYTDFMKEMLLMAEDREDRRQQVHQKFEERRLQVLQDLENSAGLRETELFQTMIEFNQGLLSVLRKLVLAVESKQNCAP